MIKVSLIVPVYNTSTYLKKCIDSLLSQTLKEIEIIVINDGSRDNSESIVKSYTDERIVYIKKENEGIGKTRNLGIDKAQGEFVAFVDSDDYLDENFCYVLYSKAKESNCDLVICDYYEDRDNLLEVKFPFFEDTNLRDNPTVINNINLGPCNKMYSRELLIDNKIRFEENLKYEDAPFVVKTLLKSKKMGKVDKCLTYYVIHENSETTVRDSRIFDILKITKIIIDEMNKVPNLKDETINMAVLILSDYTIQQRYIGDRKERNRFIDEAFAILENLSANWKKAICLKKYRGYKKLVKTNKTLTKIYCSVYHFLKCK